MGPGPGKAVRGAQLRDVKKQGDNADLRLLSHRPTCSAREGLFYSWWGNFDRFATCSWVAIDCLTKATIILFPIIRFSWGT